MTVRYGRNIYFGFLMVLGLALAMSFATNFLLNAQLTWPGWLIVLLWLASLGIGLAYVSVKYLIQPTAIRYTARTRLILVVLSVIASGLLLGDKETRLSHITWIEAKGAKPEQPVTFFDQAAWGEHHSGFEIHAPDRDTARWMWRAEADLPPLLKQFGGTVRLLMTQPEWVIFNEKGQLYQKGDGVEVRFVVDRKDSQEVVQRVTLNLHANLEERRWQTVKVHIPAGSQRLTIEAWPGPSGSNNWFDRVWISVETAESLLESIFNFVNWFTISLLIYLSGSILLTLFRSPYLRLGKNVANSSVLTKGGPLLSPRRLVHSRDLLRELVARDMKLRYKRSVLGMAWSLLNPLAQLLVFNFVFSSLLPLNIPNYTSFLFIGILVFTWFQTSLLTATGAIVDNRDLIRRPGFPITILPIVTVMSHLIHFLLALPILFLSLLLSDVTLAPVIAALPGVIALQFLFTLSLAYLVAPLHVTFRDTQYLLSIFLMLGLYLSPVFYDPQLISDRYQLFYHLNPLAILLDAYRAILLQGESPDLLPLVILAALSVALFGIGYRIFVLISHRFAEEL